MANKGCPAAEVVSDSCVPIERSSAPLGREGIGCHDFHGFRPPAANSTRGYPPSPLPGRFEVRRFCHRRRWSFNRGFTGGLIVRWGASTTVELILLFGHDAPVTCRASSGSSPARRAGLKSTRCVAAIADREAGKVVRDRRIDGLPEIGRGGNAGVCASTPGDR